MFLSNPQAAAVALSLLIITAAGCSWFRSSDPVSLTPTAVAPPESGLPFETSEPATYQADFVTIATGSESRSHFARKEGKWRMDTFAGEKITRSIISANTLAYIDHTTKQYSEPPVTGPDLQPPFITDLTTSLLSEKQPAKFERLGVEGTLEKYKVSVNGSDVSSTIIFDTQIKMVIRHEFEGGFAFEMRNLTLEVDDGVFAVPSGYRKVSWTVFKQQ
jgi:hypothetical protein